VYVLCHPWAPVYWTVHIDDNESPGPVIAVVEITMLSKFDVCVCVCGTKHPRVVQLPKAVRLPPPNQTMPTEEMDLHIRRASLVPKNEHSQYTWTTEEDEMRDMLAAGDMREDTTAQPTDEELTQMLEIKQEMDTDMSLSGTFFLGVLSFHNCETLYEYMQTNFTQHLVA
jgi:hypothetical protein